MRISKHAYKRFIERTDFTPNQRNHNANQAWQYGYKIGQFCGEFYTFLNDKQLGGDRTSVKIWAENIYVFDNRHRTLITVYPIPKQFIPVKRFLGKDNYPCVIEVNGNYLISEDGEHPTVFKSKQSANNYIKNNASLNGQSVKILAWKE